LFFIKIEMKNKKSTRVALKMSTRESLEAVLCYDLSATYCPIQRKKYRTTEKDIELIDMWHKGLRSGTHSSVKWFLATKGYSRVHRESLLDRANSLLHEPPDTITEGSEKWRQIIFGFTEAEYDELDRIGHQKWLEDTVSAKEVATSLAPLFRTHPLEEQVFWYRESRNPHAWAALTSLLTEEEKKAIESKSESKSRSNSQEMTNETM